MIILVRQNKEKLIFSNYFLILYSFFLSFLFYFFIDIYELAESTVNNNQEEGKSNYKEEKVENILEVVKNSHCIENENDKDWKDLEEFAVEDNTDCIEVGVRPEVLIDANSISIPIENESKVRNYLSLT